MEGPRVLQVVMIISWAFRVFRAALVTRSCGETTSGLGMQVGNNSKLNLANF